MKSHFRATFLSVLPFLYASVLTVAVAQAAHRAEVAGVKVELVDYEGAAAISVEAVDKYSVRIHVDPRADSSPLTIRVELPNTGPNTWPAVDVEVVDAKGRPVAVRRSGIEWQRLLIPASPACAAYLVRAVDPWTNKPRPRLPSEKQRHVTDPATDLSATICSWRGGRLASLSIRFDDSHPTHLSKAIPILRQYGFRGTFMVNPGNPGFQQHKAEWEACARRGDHELANHSMHHRGAVGDEQMEREIADASKYIWSVSPRKSKLIALNLGGGTTWETTKTLRYYLDKHHLFDASSGSLGMDDVYGDRPAAFLHSLQRHIERGLWCRTHFHDIGEGQSTSEDNFLAALDIAKKHESQLWIAGMADIYKYQTERRAAKLEIRNETARRVTLELSCLTDPSLYDHPLTIEVALPSAWPLDGVAVTRNGASVPTQPAVSSSGKKIVRFDAPAVPAAYVIERSS